MSTQRFISEQRHYRSIQRRWKAGYISTLGYYRACVAMAHAHQERMRTQHSERWYAIFEHWHYYYLEKAASLIPGSQAGKQLSNHGDVQGIRDWT